MPQEFGAMGQLDFQTESAVKEHASFQIVDKLRAGAW
jgi:hypothetical protein